MKRDGGFALFSGRAGGVVGWVTGGGGVGYGVMDRRFLGSLTRRVNE